MKPVSMESVSMKRLLRGIAAVALFGFANVAGAAKHGRRPLNPQNRYGRFGRNPVNPAPDVTIQHDVANNQHLTFAEMRQIRRQIVA